MSHCSPSGPAVCNRARAELEALLDRSNFGANEAMYACYFEHGGSDKQPLCIARHGQKPLTHDAAVVF